MNCWGGNTYDMQRIVTILCLLTVCLGLSAQRAKRVRGEYTYHAPENVTLEEAKRTALERAKIQLIADEFGTVIAQTNTTFVENSEEKSAVDFQSFSVSDVKGEWIETIGEPKYSISFEQNMLVVKVRVEGRIREITKAKVEFTAKILCNGTEDRFECSDFKDGDELYLSFTSPTDGYLAVYLLDTNRDAYCLLPYQDDTDGKVFVKHGEDYVFFSIKNKPKDEQTPVQEYNMTCEKGMETNFIYIIFSPNAFAKANDAMSTEWAPRTLSYSDFQAWLSRCRRHDKDIVVEMKEITIRKE